MTDGNHLGWRELLDASEEQAIAELFELIRMPSVSTDPVRSDDVRKVAAWVQDRLLRAGVPEVFIDDVDGGHPAVIGRWDVDPSLPTILIYGHYDVQPEDPIELWESPPFEPEVRDGLVFGRGAADMKGNLLTAIHGVEANAKANGGRPAVNVAFIFEGEEEIGSPSFPGIVRRNAVKLRADAAISADGGQYRDDEPSMTIARKGLVGMQIDLVGANSDLHSGSFGSLVANAARSAAELVASFHDAENRVAVAGFYDRVVDLTEDERAEVATGARDESEMAASLGLTHLRGESGYTGAERVAARPTLDINGIWSGYQGAGGKTVTPCEAHIKLTCRLAANQDPAEIIDLIRDHVARHTPDGITATCVAEKDGAKPYLVDRANPVYQAAARTLESLYGVAPIAQRAGGTIPATAIFLDELGIHTIGFAWSSTDSRAHAPNERYSVKNFLRGRRGYAMLLDELARS